MHGRHPLGWGLRESCKGVGAGQRPLTQGILYTGRTPGPFAPPPPPGLLAAWAVLAWRLSSAAVRGGEHGGRLRARTNPPIPSGRGLASQTQLSQWSVELFGFFVCLCFCLSVLLAVFLLRVFFCSATSPFACSCGLEGEKAEQQQPHCHGCCAARKRWPPGGAACLEAGSLARRFVRSFLLPRQIPCQRGPLPEGSSSRVRNAHMQQNETLAGGDPAGRQTPHEGEPLRKGSPSRRGIRAWRWR